MRAHAQGWAAAGVALLPLVLAACFGEAAPPAGAHDRAAAMAQADRRDDEIVRLRARVAELERQLRERPPQECAPASPLPGVIAPAAGEDVAAARAEADRYRAGLERCVAQLNAVIGGALTPPATEPAPAPAAARATVEGAPMVNVLGGTVRVTGRIWNGGDAPYSGFVSIELLLDGRFVDRTRQFVQVAPRAGAAFGVSFPTTETKGTFTAQATLE